ncbi:MAG: hypothetical protein ACLP1X_34090 [Polyangiaceae bacterium]
MSRKVLGPLSVSLGVAALLWACEDKPPPPDTPQADASAGKDKYATADPKLAKALQAAASASGSGENGPPPEGVFPAGVANQRHPAGVLTKVDVVSDGSDPRVSLDPGPEGATSWYGPAGLRLGLQMGQRVAMPTIDLGFALGPAKKDEGGSDWLQADLKKAGPSKEQLGQLPPGTDKEIASLEGTQIRMKVGPDGRESDVQVLLGKGTQSELDRLAQSAAEALVFAMVPLPTKPVGVGAQWIAETRMPLSGVDTISYRAYRVKSITGNRVHLSLDVKSYATNTDVELPGVPKGATLDQFMAEAQGEMEIVRGEALARMFDVQQRVVMVFATAGGAPPPTQPGEPPAASRLTAQLQGQATFVRGDDLRGGRKP